MSRLARLRPSGGFVIGVLALVLALTGGAVARSLITGKDVKDGSLTGKDIRNHSLTRGDISIRAQRALRGRRGARGATGATGATGPKGDAGAPVNFSPEKWAVIGRNSAGSPSVLLGTGPYGRTGPGQFAATQAPPFGIGSLQILVAGPTTPGNPTTAEKLNYGNQTDFANLNPKTGVTALSYYVYKDVDSGASTRPGIAIEADPNANTKTFTTLNYLPENSQAPSAPATPAAGTWQKYDATAAGSKWYSTADLDPNTNLCELANPCSFTELQSQLGPNAKVTYSLGFGKGRDDQFRGALDGLRVNGTVYDFEPLGVQKRTP